MTAYAIGKHLPPASSSFLSLLDVILSVLSVRLVLREGRAKIGGEKTNAEEKKIQG